MSAKPIGKAPVATLGMASREPWPAEISTLRPAASKWPLSMAAKYGAEGPSNFQSSANGMSSWALAVPAKATAAARNARANFVHGLQPPPFRFAKRKLPYRRRRQVTGAVRGQSMPVCRAAYLESDAGANQGGFWVSGRQDCGYLSRAKLAGATTAYPLRARKLIRVFVPDQNPYAAVHVDHRRPNTHRRVGALLELGDSRADVASTRFRDADQGGLPRPFHLCGVRPVG